MKVLILGGSGMLGHKLWQTLSRRFETHATLRQESEIAERLGILERGRVLNNVSVNDFDSVVAAFEAVRPDVAVNCIGIVKQDAAAKDAYQSIEVNALFPHRLAHLCRAMGVRLIHLSTDCVFSGRRGNYNESDIADAEDVYGRTKWLGEVNYDNCLTIRTSMIGRELRGSHGLVEWFMGRTGQTVRGFKRAVFSGFTTVALSRIIGDVIAEQPDLVGTWHIAANPINKFELLSIVKQAFHLDIEIVPEEDFVCDRSLNGERFAHETGFKPMPWSNMIEEMANDSTPYHEIRRTNVNR